MQVGFIWKNVASLSWKELVSAFLLQNVMSLLQKYMLEAIISQSVYLFVQKENYLMWVWNTHNVGNNMQQMIVVCLGEEKKLKELNRSFWRPVLAIIRC